MCRDAALPSPISARDLVLALAREMRTLREIGDRLPLPAGLDREATIAAQDHDLLVQTLDELAAFLECGADGFEAEPTAAFGPALTRIRLAALASRLAGDGKGAPPASGEMELF